MTIEDSLLSVKMSLCDYGTPALEVNSVGFRVASVPEPSAVVLTMLSVSACLTRRRRFFL